MIVVKGSRRFYEIDLLRFFAALSVVFFHYTFRGYAANDLSVLFFPYLGEISKYGYLGFHLFFMISGYVILLSASRKSSVAFVVSRITRLYPAYWFSVTLTFLTILMIGGSRYGADWWQYLINLTMMHGYIGINSIDGVYWTLMVELKFYFLIFIIISINQMNNIKYYLGAWLMLSVVLTGYEVKYIGFFLFPEWCSYFIAGACFYLIYREGISPYKVVITTVSLFLSSYNAIKGIEGFYKHFNVELNALILLLLIFIFYFVFLMIALDKTQFISSRKFIALGVLTYPLYLIHQNIGFMLFNYINEFRINKYIILFVVLSVMLYVAYCIHTHIERKTSKYLSAYLLRIYAVVQRSTATH